MADRGRKAAVISWATFLVALAIFVLAAVLTPETPAGMAAHRRDAVAWQHRQAAKGAARPPVLARPGWEATSWGRTLARWDHAAFYRVNHDWNNRLFDRVMPVATAFGDGKTQAVLLLLVLAWSYWARRPDWRVTAYLGVAGIILGALAPLGKKIVPRYRPPSLYPYTDVLLVHPLYAGSFPSGHTLTSFTIATIVVRRHPWTAPWAFGLAVLVGLSRVSVGVHWPLDVIGGAILGLLVGWLVTAWWDRRERRNTRRAIMATGQ